MNVSNSSTNSFVPKVVRIPGTNDLFAIWIEAVSATQNDLFFAKSTDGGATWMSRWNLASGGQIMEGGWASDLLTIGIAVDDPYLHIVMQWRPDDSYDFEIYYLRSEDLGATWLGWYALTNNSTDSRYPDIAVYGEYVHVTYQDSWPGQEDIMYKRIPNYGTNGAVDHTRRLTYSTTDAYFPRIAVSNGGYCVSVVYQDVWGDNYNVFYKHIDVYGSGAYQTKQLTFGTGGLGWNGLPDIATSVDSADEQYVYIVYQAYWPGNREIIYKRLTGFGSGSFSTYTARLTYSDAESRTNTIEFDSAFNCVHIAYQDAWPGNFDIMYKKFLSYGGAGFSTQRVSWGTGDSIDACVFDSGQWAYIIWSDNSSGNYEIYIKFGS